MKILCFIYAGNAWEQVSYDEYHAYNGRKEIRPPHYSLILLQKYLAKAVELRPDQLKSADYNKDGILTIADATAIQKRIARFV